MWKAVLGGDDLSHLHEGMQEFAISPNYKPLRATLDEPLRQIERFEFLEVKETRSSRGATLQHFLYRHTYGDSVLYWTIVMRDGKMTALNWEDE